MKLPKKLAALAKKIHPLRDRVVVKRFEYQHPVLYVAGVTLHKGVVLAVGPGRKIRRKVYFNQGIDNRVGPRSIAFEDGDETGQIRPMRVKVGDVVEFSFRGGIDFELDGEALLMIWEQSIYGVTNDSKSEAMLWQQSAGYDRHGNFLSGAEEWQRAS